MYKEVGKRALAVVLSLCMVLGMADFSTLAVRADANDWNEVTVTTTPSKAYYKYTGESQRPEVQVALTNGKVLTENTDYTINWEDVDTVHAYTHANESYSVYYTITGKGEYAGKSKKASYVLQPRSIAEAEVTIVNKLPIIGNNQPVYPKCDGPDPQITIEYNGNTLTGLYVEATTNDDAKSKYEEKAKENPSTIYDYYYYCTGHTYVNSKAAVVIKGVNDFNGDYTATYAICKKSLAEDTEISGIEDITYDGRTGKYEPAKITVKDKITKETLTEEIDYKVDYIGDTTRPGKIEVKLTGQGDYAGGDPVSKYYTIKKSMLDYSDNFNIATIADQTYTGAEITIADGKIVVTDNNKMLTKDTHYTVSYGENTDAGFGTIYITGVEENGYIGYLDRTFRILPRNVSDLTITLDNAADYTYSGEAKQPTATVTYNGQLIDDDNYEVAYGENINAGTGSVTIKGKKNSNGKENLIGEKTVTFDIKKKSLEDEDIVISVDKSDLSYDGSPKEPKVSVSWKGNYLKEDIDYTVNCTNHTTAGSATVTVTGIGNYSGTYSENYTIAAVKLTKSNTEITGIENAVYNGTAIQQTNLKVSWNGKILTKGKDYEVGYADNTNAGTATVTITGKGNYDGSISETFIIEKGDISNTNMITASLKETNIPFNYSKPQPAVIVRQNGSSGSRTLEEGTDYTVSYGYDDLSTDYAGVGTYKVTITGKGNFDESKSVTLTFNITEMDLEQNKDNFKIFVSEGVVLDETYMEEYKGEPVTLKNLEIRYVVDDSIYYGLTKDIDYTVGITNNEGPGKGTITITGKDGSNFKGELTQDLTIKGDLSWAANTNLENITIKEQVYTGKEIELQEEDLSSKLIFQLTKPNRELIFGKDYKLNNYSNNTKVGTAEVEIAGTDDGYYYVKDNTSPIIKKEFQIVPKHINNEDKTAIDVVVAEIPTDKYQYTGQEIIPELTITYNGATLEKGTDYEIVVGERDCVNANEQAYITIQGKGNYTDKRKIYFTINPRNLEQGKIEVDGIHDTRIYNDSNGVAKISIDDPKFTFTSTRDGESLVLSQDSVDFTSECVDNDHVGTARLIITASGNNFTGTVEVAYILKGDLSNEDCTVINVINDKVYNGYAQTLTADDIQVRYIDQDLEFEKDFTIEYNGDNINASNSVAFTVKGIGDYYQGNNSTATFVIEPKDIAEKGIAEDQKEIVVKGMKENGYTYTGEVILPYSMDGFEITYGAFTLKEQNAENGKGDYTIALKGETINVTTETMQEEEKPYIEVTAVEGGNYTGVLKIPYTIIPQSVNIEEIVAKNQILSTDEETGEVTVTEEKDIVVVDCDGELVTFDNLVVYWVKSDEDKIKLIPYTTDVLGNKEEKDYRVSYERRKSTEEGKEEEELCFGETKLIIEGLGNYNDTKTVTFMVKGDLGDSDHVTVLNIDDQPYTVGGVKPKVQVYYYEQLLEENVDYELNWKNNKDVADAESENAPFVEITGKGAFDGTSTTKKFKIVPRDLAIDDGVMTLEGLKEEGYPYTGKAVEPSGLTLKNNGSVVTRKWYTISYDRNVNGGKATDLNPPVVIITAVEGGNYTGKMEVPFTIVGIPLTDKTIEISLDENQIYTGSELHPKVTVKHSGNILEEGKHYQLSWKNSTDVAKSSDGKSAPTVIVEGIGNYSGVAERTFNIVSRSMETYESEFQISIAPQTYTGEELVPDPVVKNAAGGLLEKDKDYTVSAGTNNIDANKGKETKATITIKGIGNYSGTITPEFTINPQYITDEKEFVISGIVDKVYNSKEQIQQPTITWMEKQATDDAADGSESDVADDSEGNDSTIAQVKTVLAAKSDYTIEYKNHVKAGTATAVITGTGNYAGSRTVTFKIAQRSLSDKGIVIKDIANQIYTGNALTPIPEIYYEDAEQGINTKLVYGTDYTVDYDNNTKVGTKIATVKITGKGNYSGTTSTKFTIVGNISLASVSKIATQDYTGSAIEPKPIVTQGGKTLVEGTDYSLSYSNNVEAGTATITIKGMNEYGGTKKVKFTICRDITGGLSVVGLGAKYLYTGKAIIPTLGKVSAYGKVLTLNKDYAVTVTNNVNVGTATLVVKGIGAYKGSKTYHFDIVRRSISQCSVSSISTKSYTGKALTPAITVKYNNKTLTPGTDYTLVYQNNIMPGTASIIIKGKGNLNGSKMVTFKIEMPNIKNAKAATVGTDKIKVSWKKQSTVTGYQIYDNKNKKVAQIKGNGNTSYTIAGLNAGTTYKYKVRAYVIKNGRTCYSAFTSLITVATKPNTPSITVKSSKSKEAVISWKKVSGASGYEIYRSTKKSSGYKKIATTTKLNYTNKKLTAKKQYYYKVRAYCTVNGKKIYSSYSSVKYVTIKK